jgi:hypothetical protein
MVVVEDPPSFAFIYVLSVIFVAYMISLICAKLYSPFWFHQPVYHIYELYPKLSFSKQPYWKKTRPPTNGIFCDTKHIVSSPITDMKNEVWEKVLHLIQGHYMDSEFVLNHMSMSTMKKKIYGESFLSCFYEDKIMSPSFIETIDTENLFGLLISRPLIVHFLKYPEKNTVLHEFVFVCVHENYKKKNISRNLIQTHIYNHYHYHHHETKGYVFQKHIDLCKAIVPLVQYQTYTFVLRDTYIRKLPRNYSIRCLNTTHIDLWRGIYAQILLQFEIALLPEFHFTLDWLKNERYTIYVTVYRVENVEHVHGVYVLENTHLSWESESLEKPHMVRLAASVNFSRKRERNDIMLFFHGFLNCLNSFLLDNRKEIGILEIPCISDNDLLLSKWQEKYEMRNVTESAYYMYNLIYPNSPVRADSFIIL